MASQHILKSHPGTPVLVAPALPEQAPFPGPGFCLQSHPQPKVSSDDLCSLLGPGAPPQHQQGQSLLQAPLLCAGLFSVLGNYLATAKSLIQREQSLLLENVPHIPFLSVICSFLSHIILALAAAPAAPAAVTHKLCPNLRLPLSSSSDSGSHEHQPQLLSSGLGIQPRHQSKGV